MKNKWLHQIFIVVFSLLFCLWTLRINSTLAMALRLRARRPVFPDSDQCHWGAPIATIHAWLPAIWGWPTPASSFSVSMPRGAHLGEPSQSFSRGKFENHSLTIKYKHMQKSEYHPLKQNHKFSIPILKTKFTNGIPALSSPCSLVITALFLCLIFLVFLTFLVG